MPPGGVALDGDEFDPAGDGVTSGFSSILTDVAGLSAERDEYLAALQRVQADFENYRKRVLRQQEEQADRGVFDLVGKLLPVLDVLDLAQAHLDSGEGAADDVGQVLKGARALLLDTLAKEGLERVDAPDVPFDPTIHDAVAHAASEGTDASEVPMVDEVLRAGYVWRAKVLRPAMVRVRG
jgi:molecular chaperone GrpE